MRPFQRAGMGREGREKSRVSPGGPGGVGRPSCRDGKGQEVLPKGREESGVSHSVPRRSQEALPQGQEGSGGPRVGREGLVGPPGWPGEVERDGRGRKSTQEDLEDWEAFPERWEGWEDTPEGTGWIEMDGRHWESPQEGREDWEAFLKAGRGCEAL